MGELSSLKGLGPTSEKHLNDIGVYTKTDLEKLGAVQAILKLKNECGIKPNLNFLYAIVGAIENKHWLDIAKSQRQQLIFELESHQELEKVLNENNIQI